MMFSKKKYRERDANLVICEDPNSCIETTYLLSFISEEAVSKGSYVSFSSIPKRRLRHRAFSLPTLAKYIWHADDAG